MSSTQSGIFERRFISHLRKLTRIYWTSTDAKKGAALLALCVAGELGTVYGNVRLAHGAEPASSTPCRTRRWPTFLSAMEMFLAVALVVVFVSTYRIYVRNILQIRWREQLTDYFLGEWMGPHAYWHRELHHKDTDNPDQRISRGHPELRRQRARPVAVAALRGRHADLVRRHALDALRRLAAAHRRATSSGSPA